MPAARSRSTSPGAGYGPARSRSLTLYTRASYIISDIIRAMTPGQLLREARRRHGVTQTQLATRARTSQAAISRIERDLVSPGVGTLSSLLAMLNERLVVAAEPIDWGHDRSLLRENLNFTPEQRIERQAVWSRGMRRIQRAARR
ncbi:MAG: helix-turn-helix transcriptional regulator [Actinobacteria bacterium]|nr:helix-turn-helix transcriptional regulator [Actinomycetota bacterium]